MEFEWDRQKAASNHRKHGVAFDEALTVFADPLAWTFDDTEHSAEEPREMIVGHSVRHRLMMVFFTERRDRVRIISARLLTKKERRKYEQNTPKK